MTQETLAIGASTRAPRQQWVPRIICGLNYAALGVLALILVPAAVVRPYQLIVVLPALALLVGFYWIFQRNTTITALYCGLSLSVVLWIIICEHIVAIDNALGTQITKELPLGMQLQAVAKANLKKQFQYREVCCGDPLSFHYQPGSAYRLSYDCTPCTAHYETITDATGHLNRRYDFNDKQIDMFVTGNGVLQGYGVPSVVEFLNDLLPITIWNLSSGRYGPRQKVSALITYALPRHPKWIVLEFYSPNDLEEVTFDEVCQDSGNYVCLFNIPERNRRILRHPVFSSMVDPSETYDGMFEDYTENSFTLAVTRYMVDKIKATTTPTTWKRIDVGDSSARGNRKKKNRFSASDVYYPGHTRIKVVPAKKFEWVNEGMRLTFKRYDRLAAELVKMKQAPTVILLYNPSAYEVYRNVMVDRDGEMDRVSEFQRQAVRDYAAKHGWTFVDLTASLSDEVTRRGVWIYGNHDTKHWSPQGTGVVAPVLARELSNVLRP